MGLEIKSSNNKNPINLSHMDKGMVFGRDLCLFINVPNCCENLRFSALYMFSVICRRYLICSMGGLVGNFIIISAENS